MNPVARRFSRAAHTYEQGAGLHRHVAARLLGMTPDPDVLGAGRLLEVGCGTGVLTEQLRRRYPNASLCLLDVAEAMVSCVRDRWGDDPRLTFLVKDVRTYRESRPFDWIFSSSALHWAVPLESTFAGLRSNLVPGGGLSVALMVDGTLSELHRLRNRLAPAKQPADHLPSREDVLDAVQRAGFSVTTSEQESIQARYHTADDFLRTLHAQGLTGGPVSRGVSPLSRDELRRLRETYDHEFKGEGGGVFATFEVLYVTACG